MSTDTTASAQVAQQIQEESPLKFEKPAVASYTWDATGNVVPSADQGDQRFDINERHEIITQLESQDADPTEANAVPYTVPLDEIALYENQATSE